MKQIFLIVITNIVHMVDVSRICGVNKLTSLCIECIICVSQCFTLFLGGGKFKMIQEKEFRVWLTENYTYSPAVVGDIVSRIKRANRILEFDLDDAYQFYLEHEESYKVLSVSVRSQIKKAVKLYQAYMKKG